MHMNLTNCTRQSQLVEFVKFRLIRNSKPKDNRNKLKNKDFYDVKEYNTGIPTGKLNNIIIIDLDLYINRENNILLKHSGIVSLKSLIL